MNFETALAQSAHRILWSPCLRSSRQEQTSQRSKSSPNPIALALCAELYRIWEHHSLLRSSEQCVNPLTLPRTLRSDPLCGKRERTLVSRSVASRFAFVFPIVGWRKSKAGSEDSTWLNFPCSSLLADWTPKRFLFVFRKRTYRLAQFTRHKCGTALKQGGAAHDDL